MKLKYVFIHGTAGWGSYDKRYEKMPYWGMHGGDLIDFLNEKGFDSYAAYVSPFGSAWDRACELYAQLWGKKVDYGSSHSKTYGHDRFGRDYTGCSLIPDLTDDTKLVLIGHSFGGTTARMFAELMAHGDEEERAAAKDGDLSPLFLGGMEHRIHSVAEGQDAFQFGGCWEWNDIVDFDYTGKIGIMPVPQNLQDDYTGKIVGGGSKFFYIDNSDKTTEEQQQAAKDFLNWLVTSDEGKTLISETCAMVSPFKSNTVPCANDIGAIVKQYVDAGNMVDNYNYDPDDHYSVLGASMQKYLADEIDRAGLAKEIQDHWANVTPVEH